MSLEDTLARFGEQFEWQPHIENAEKLGRYIHTVVYGMGGSHLGAWLIKRYGDRGDIFIHRNYGFADEAPHVAGADTLHILSSYSGTTEETLDAAREVLAHNASAAVVTTGGDLLAFAKEHDIPYVQIPETGLEPRMAIGFSMLALARMTGDDSLENLIRAGGKAVNPLAGKEEGTRLSIQLKDKIPLVWASAGNFPLAFIWKIKFNETAKIPAFCNALPELCHNELTGFDVVGSTKSLSAPLSIIMLEDTADHPRVQKRMEVARDMLSARGIAIIRVPLHNPPSFGFEKAFRSALLADWVSLSLAEHYGVPNPETPLITEFKKKLLQ